MGYELWSDTFEVEGPGEHRRGDAGVPVTFLLPPSKDLSTSLSERPPRYWELKVEADTPGVDYEATFLVPVYAKDPVQAGTEVQ